MKASVILVNSSEDVPIDAFGYLASHSLELFLKSYLLSAGVEEVKLQKIGHNLEKAWHSATNEGLNIDLNPPQWCKKLNNAYDRPFLLRYAKNNTGIVIPAPKHVVTELKSLSLIVALKLGVNKQGNFV